MGITEEILSQMPGDILGRLRAADKQWQSLRTETSNVPQVVYQQSQSLGESDWDVVISGGTLGILLAAALQTKGWRVAVLERGILRGRDQEWNISRQELQVFIELGLLSESELEQAIATEYNPARVSFYQGYELWVNNILNIGVDPVFLLETLKQKFLVAGGALFEKTPFETAVVHPDGVWIKAGGNDFKTRLLIDAMGHFSAIAKQARQGKKPEGVCLVVGSCAYGYPTNQTGDLIATFTPIQHQCQYFWEAFPARDGRTTYLFTYVDPHPQRFSLEFLLDEYFRLLPQYQNIELSQLSFKRFLFGFFPSYRDSPLRLPWNRLLAIGDSASAQSPVSFGGFGAMVRHLKRLTGGIDESLKIDALDQNALALLQSYQPNISVTWLFQQTMSVGIGKSAQPNQVNQLMSAVFEVMDKLGEEVLNPFLQDVVQFSALAKTLIRVNPKYVLPILPQIGIYPFVDWSWHYFNLALYSSLSAVGNNLSPIINQFPPRQQFIYQRFLDNWKYGSGKDFHDGQNAEIEQKKI